MFSSVFGLGGLEGDPFFSAHQEQMRAMHQMFRDPFADRYGGMLGLTDGRQGALQNVHPLQRRNDALAPVDMFSSMMMGGGLFGPMNSLMGQMQSIQNDPNAMCYSQQSVYSYSSDGRGQPKVFEAHSTTKTAPGGVKETKKAVRDSAAGIEKMAIGHHIGERGHVVQKSRDTRTGQMDEEEQLLYIDEDGKASFNQEWRNRMQSPEMRDRGLRGARQQAALPSVNREDLRSGAVERPVHRAARRNPGNGSDPYERRHREPL